MRIESATTAAIQSSRERPSAPAEAPAKARDPASVVSIGEGATAASNATGVQGSGHGVTARIARIRELLADGNYVVDMDKLSERILDDDLARSSS